MKLLHLADLHIGKRVNEFSMIEDQTYILTKIMNIIVEEKPQGIILAGDIYDKSVPSAEAVQLFDDFLVRLSKHQLKVFVISGNHDSPERIAFGSQLMESSGVYMSPVYDGNIKPIILSDQGETIEIYMLPFIKPAHVRRYFPDAEINSYSDALKVALASINKTDKIQGTNISYNAQGIEGVNIRILITHQFVTGASRCESEDISVGGSDNVEATVFDGFDYVALGHIHRPQSVVRETIRYCGTPLKYSFSEANHKKSITVIETGMDEKNQIQTTQIQMNQIQTNQKQKIQIRTIPLIPKRDMREIKGTYMEVTQKSFYEGTNLDDYIRVTLTDEEDIPAAINKLRIIYPNIMKLDYDNKRTKSNGYVEVTEYIEHKTPTQLFSELFEKQNNQEMTKEQLDFTNHLIEKIWEDGR